MATLIDYTSQDPTTINSIFSKIQKRYFDPYSISITTETNKQIFFSDYLNNFIKTLLGTDNEPLNGLITTFNTETDTYYEFQVSKGKSISDGVIIEFTDDIILRIPKNSNNTLNTNEHALIYIDYQFVKTYPYNIATIKYVHQKSLINTLSGKSFTPVSIIEKQSNTQYYIFPNINDDLYTPDNIETFISNISDSYIQSILQNAIKPLKYRKNIDDVISNLIDFGKQLYLEFLSLSSTVFQDILNINQKLSMLEEYVTDNFINKGIPLRDTITGDLYHLKIIDGALYLEKQE